MRKSLRVRTAFNMLGPLLNPAEAAYALVGVYSPSVSHLMADALALLGTRKALVVHSMGLDELTPMGPADVLEVSQGVKRAYSLEPLDLGIPRCEVEDLAGGDAALNARILQARRLGVAGARVAARKGAQRGLASAVPHARGTSRPTRAPHPPRRQRPPLPLPSQDVFGGARGAVADALCLNAGVALAAANVAADAQEGVAMAQEAQRSGRTGDTLRAWIETSRAAREAELAVPA